MTQVPQESGFSAVSGPRAEGVLGPAAAGTPPRAPLAGILVGVALVLGFVGWTTVRIHAANQALAAVSTKRAADARRAPCKTPPAPQKVHTVRATPESWQPVVEFEGSLVAAQSAALGFKVNGRISTIRVKLGQAVKSGALLGSLDGSEAAAQQRSAEAQLRAAQAQLALADDSATRTTSMVKSGALSEAQGVQGEQQESLAAAQLDAAKAALSLTQVNLGNQELGRAVRRHRHPRAGRRRAPS